MASRPASISRKGVRISPGAPFLDKRENCRRGLAGIGGCEPRQHGLGAADADFFAGDAHLLHDVGELGDIESRVERVVAEAAERMDDHRRRDGLHASMVRRAGLFETRKNSQPSSRAINLFGGHSKNRVIFRNSSPAHAPSGADSCNSLASRNR